MPLHVASSQKDGDYEMPPEGMQSAICIWVVNLGNHFNERSQKYQPKVSLTFELCRCLMKDNRPFVVSAQYTNSFYGSSIAKSLLSTWFNKRVTEETALNFDWFSLAGRHATVQVQYSDDGKWANIAGLTPPRDEDKGLESYNDIITWTFGEGGLPEQLPDWIKAKVMSSREWNETGQQNEGPKLKNEMNPENAPF
jgi:hypothetical protein